MWKEKKSRDLSPLNGLWGLSEALVFDARGGVRSTIPLVCPDCFGSGCEQQIWGETKRARGRTLRGQSSSQGSQAGLRVKL